MNIGRVVEKINKENKTKRVLHRVIAMLMCISVFFTTYALMLPAITMDKDSGAMCGLLSHKHSNKCLDENGVLICNMPEHEHDMDCFSSRYKVSPYLCSYNYEHMHSEKCYSNQKLICSLSEHTHDSTCLMDAGLLCGLEEGEEHYHNDSCFLDEFELSCRNVDEDHVHSELCWTLCSLLVCHKKEQKAHYHNENCYNESRVFDSNIAVKSAKGGASSVDGDKQIGFASFNTVQSSPLRSSSQNISLVWDPLGVDHISIAPNANDSNTSATMLLHISQSAGNYNVGDIEIRLPLHFIEGRDGTWADQLTMSRIPEAPAVNSQIPFSYTVDSANNEIVIRNNSVITDAMVLDAQFIYSFTPSTVRDGETGIVEASYRTRQNGVWSASQTCQIDYSIDTSMEPIKVKKRFSSRHTQWNPLWGTAPANVSDLFFIKYRGWIEYNVIGGTQPSAVSVVDTPGQTGQIVFWAMGAFPDHYSITTTLTPGMYLEFGYDSSSLEALNLPLHNDVIDSEHQLARDAYAFDIIVAYPKDPYMANGQIVDNVFNVTQTPLDGIDDPVVYEDTASYKYSQQSFSYTTGSSLYKYGRSNLGRLAYETERPSSNSYNKSGALDSGSLTLLENDLPAHFLYSIETKAQGYNATVDNGSPSFSTWTLQAVDDQMYLEGELLLPGDYEITELYTYSISETEWEYDLDSGQWILHTYGSPSGERLTHFSILTRTGETGDWQRQQTSSNGWQILPAGTHQTMFQFTGNALGVSIHYFIKIKLNPTAHVKSLISGKLSAYFSNVGSMIIRDADGSILNEQDESTIGAGTLRDQIIAHDQNAGYGLSPGKVLYHKQQTDVLDSMYFVGSLQKSATSSYDNVQNTTRLQYTVKPVSNRLGFSMGISSTMAISFRRNPTALQDFVDQIMSTIGMHLDSFTFYDLMPIGMTVDPNTIVVDTPGNAQDLITELQVIENWRNSGRTMIIAEVDTSNSYTGQLSGMYGMNPGANPQLEITIPIQLKFTAYYSDDAFYDYGSQLHNVSALQDNSVSAINFESAYPDDPSSLPSSFMNQDEKDAFYDLNGVPDDRNNTLYAHAVNTLQKPAGGISGFFKSVKSQSDSSFSSQTITSPDGIYTYRLRLAISELQVIKDLVFYDVLEEAYGENEFWKGSFAGIDTTQLSMKGIAPVVYYSTQTGLDPHNNTGDRDLTDTTIWTTVAPDDLSTVTAIAVDARRKTDDSIYQSAPGASFVVQIQMKAPDDGRMYLDPVIFAWNKTVASYSSRSASSGGAWSAVSTEESNITKVRMTQTFDLSIKKIDELTREILPGVSFELRNAANAVVARGTTDNNGQLMFSGLEVSTTYYLRETRALPYYLPAGPWTVTVNNIGDIQVTDDQLELLDCSELNWIVPNSAQGMILPSTGSNGERIAVYVGSGLMSISLLGILIVCTVLKKRRVNNI